MIQEKNEDIGGLKQVEDIFKVMEKEPDKEIERMRVQQRDCQCLLY